MVKINGYEFKELKQKEVVGKNSKWNADSKKGGSVCYASAEAAYTKKGSELVLLGWEGSESWSFELMTKQQFKEWGNDYELKLRSSNHGKYITAKAIASVIENGGKILYSNITNLYSLNNALEKLPKILERLEDCEKKIKEADIDDTVASQITYARDDLRRADDHVTFVKWRLEELENLYKSKSQNDNTTPDKNKKLEKSIQTLKTQITKVESYFKQIETKEDELEKLAEQQYSDIKEGKVKPKVKTQEEMFEEMYADIIAKLKLLQG